MTNRDENEQGKENRKRFTIEGELFHEIEEFGGKKYEHIGFRDPENRFGELLAQLVPEIGMHKRARIILELVDDG